MVEVAVSFDVGTKNLGFCKLFVKKETKEFEIIDWEVISVVGPEVNVNKTSIEDLVVPFYTTVLQNISNWLEFATVVYIESQPLGRARNLKTKILSHILQILCHYTNSDIQIQFVHPSLKLKDMVGPREYRLNKKYAVSKTLELISSIYCKSAETCTELFVGSKRDDLADSFLQGYYACIFCEVKQTKEKPKKKIKQKHDSAQQRAIEFSSLSLK